MLEPSERESVRGDFAEAGEAGGPALLGVLGLVVRRQMSPWNGWRPWLALVGIVVPVGAFLTLSGVALSGGYDLSLWILQNHAVIDPTVLRENGLSLQGGIALLLYRSLLLAGWSWCAGYAIGALSRRAISINASLFCLMLLAAEVFVQPKAEDRKTAAQLLPSIIQVSLVLLPSLLGMRRALRVALIPGALAILSAIALAASFTFPAFRGFPPGSWQIGLLMAGCHWPLAYVTATGIAERWRSNPA